jgi:hypothetical protein
MSRLAELRQEAEWRRWWLLWGGCWWLSTLVEMPRTPLV